MAPTNIARTDFACCKVGNLVYVICGWVSNGSDRHITKSLEVYNLDGNTWTDEGDFPGIGHGLYACAVKDKLY